MAAAARLLATLDCKALRNYTKRSAQECPSARSPHALSDEDVVTKPRTGRRQSILNVMMCNTVGNSLDLQPRQDLLTSAFAEKHKNRGTLGELLLCERGGLSAAIPWKRQPATSCGSPRGKMSPSPRLRTSDEKRHAPPPRMREETLETRFLHESRLTLRAPIVHHPSRA